MRATKYTAATRRRRRALVERYARSLELTCHKRNRLNDLTTSLRHCAQYVVNARRSGLMAPTQEWRDL